MEQVSKGPKGVVEELLEGVVDLLMKGYADADNAAQYVIDDDSPTGITSAQLISLSLKAPGLLALPMKREFEEDEQELVKRPKPSLVARNSPDILQCKDCFDTFPNHLMLMKHSQSAHPIPQLTDYRTSYSPVRRASTPSAQYSFSSPTRVSDSPTHVASPATAQREAYQKRPEFRKCMLCNVMFGNNEQLSAHLSSAHRNQNTYNCIAHSSCPMVFTDIKSLKRHVYEMHIKECPVCKCRFEEDCLALHLLKSHPTLTCCPICSTQYPESQSLMLHIRTQHDITRTENITALSRDTLSTAGMSRDTLSTAGMSRDRHRTDSTLTVKSETLSVDSP